LEVTEHQLVEVECPACQAVTKAGSPVGVNRQVQYGPHISAFCVYLITGQHIALERAAKMVSEWFGQPISPATINNMVNNAAAIITKEFKPVAEKLLLSAEFNHVDETGFKIAGKTRWVHSISNPLVTWIEAHDKRGRAAMDDIGILPKYGGTLVHDAWRPYDTFASLDAHQLCCAHLRRELNAVMDTHSHEPGQWCWAEQVSDALKVIIHDPACVDKQRHIIISALLCAASNDPDSLGKLGQKQTALRNRISARLDDYLRFVGTNLPPTNNPAEQEIRMVKIKQKIAGCMRTMAGAQAFTAIRSYLSTARKNKIGLAAALSSLFNEEIWLPAIP